MQAEWNFHTFTYPDSAEFVCFPHPRIIDDVSCGKYLFGPYFNDVILTDDHRESIVRLDGSTQKVDVNEWQD